MYGFFVVVERDETFVCYLKTIKFPEEVSVRLNLKFGNTAYENAVLFGLGLFLAGDTDC